ncbi:Protein of uncharacterised function (DUF3037) [Yersinia enterocolitica]|uniref:DUF3037 domain-containing protein n=1 Tax=Yersinia enterocolitica TaxID=630 RepID=UPI00028193A5|nr:DUF3037 domain-containing protein [Yersinia enterocolitica]AJI83785.1 hypothetical protein CH47_379 [Yersinia enterocolitica]EKA26774.1 hypothetical protein YWA314_12626 [Yersinia enterocolitica subsp. enterocolitica WA-314]ELI8285372.1 DUF3037 domain-containing protein [Yersinia enterocolitica]KGA71447.1 hypothetical protein DJ59_1598 [Yersinia enterocolitica]KGA76089.1 hypothetical protein DJ60_1663 [Yersinia enterocolitica]
MTTPCLYSIVRYAPYAETEEFANIGVVLCAPKNHAFYFKLTKSNDARVSAFFRDDTIFRLARDAVARELKLAQEQTKNLRTADDIANFFSYLTARKESIFHFSSTRVILAQSPENELNKIYDRFINHSDYNKERREDILAKELRHRLNTHAELRNAFKRETFGGDLTKFTMPFVAKDDEKVLCAIKPLAFVQNEPGKMMEHCDSWVSRVTRAANENLLNLTSVLFTIDGQKNPTAVETRAMDEIRRTFEKNHITCLNHNDENAIISFAKSAI